MTYTFKLARRLAVSRHFRMLPVLLVFAGCTAGDATSPENSSPDIPGIYTTRARESTPVALLISPTTVIAETDQQLRFRARGRNRAGEEVAAPVAWSTTGGTILPDGSFSAASVGTYQVTGRTRTRNGDLVQTSTITVVRRQSKLKSLSVTPGNATLSPGANQTFTAIGLLASGDTVPIGVTWSAGGGTIDAGGNYVTDDTVGTFRVIAKNVGGTLADTAMITIAPATELPPPDSSTTPLPSPEPAPAPPPPAPTLAKLTMLPASVTLVPSTSRQFSAYGTTTTGDSVAADVVFTATGGTVTATGLYTAGSVAGSYRVIATSGGLADTSAVTISVPLGSGTPSASSVPFGVIGAWSGNQLKPYINSFTLTMGAVTADNIAAMVTEARNNKVRLMLAMTGGAHSNYLTDGVFDYSKWKAKMDTYNTAAIKDVVAKGVADGIIIGNNVMDEPNVTGGGDGNTWGPAGTMTKARVDGLCAYVKGMFPTLPVGVSHAHNAFEPSNSYTVCEFLIDQYANRKGDVTTFRDEGLAMVRRDGMGIVFSMNTLNGGVQDRDGTWDCVGTGQGGLGQYAPNCRMTPTQIRDYGTVLGPPGCALLTWRYEDLMMQDSEYQKAFGDVAARLASTSASSCRRH